MSKWVRVALALGFLSLGSSSAFAWGPEGHAIVADIAQAHLSRAASAEITRLLKTERHARLDDISSWADDYRSTHPDTGPFHFVDIPLKETRYDESRDCHYDKNNNRVTELTCIVDKLPEYVAILSDTTKTDAERVEALKFVVHFVGDIHQPLHAEDNSDRGGNNVLLTYYGNDTKLHAIWDGGIIEHQFGWKLGAHFSFNHAVVAAEAANLDKQISTADRSAWATAGVLSGFPATVEGWANETHMLAPAAYNNLPNDRTGDWENAYQGYAMPVIEAQLERGGVRLAEVLNEALK
jgi:hypothetical protein